MRNSDEKWNKQKQPGPLVPLIRCEMKTKKFEEEEEGKKYTGSIKMIVDDFMKGEVEI